MQLEKKHMDIESYSGSSINSQDCQSTDQDSTVKEYILNLFSTSKDSSLLENEVELKINRSIENFMNSVDFSTDIDIRPILERFDSSDIPCNPADIGDYMDFMTNFIVNHSTRTSSPRFIGHMTSALPNFLNPMSKLVTAMNQNTVKIETSKVLTPCERQSLAMLHKMIYSFDDEFYKEHIQNINSTLGNITSGGTTANMTALWCARNAALGPSGSFMGLEKEGLKAALEYYGYNDVVIIGSKLMHYSFDKAADILGVGVENLIKIPVDKDRRVNLEELEKTVSICRRNKKLVISIIGIAGTTDTGSIDPLPQIHEIARKNNIHFHVDAAWGGPVLFSEQHRHKVHGIDMADSVTIDGHKQLYLPMGIGMVFFKNPHKPIAIEKKANYIVRKGSFDLGRRSLEGSRPAVSLYLHTALNILGKSGYRILIDEGIRKVKYMAEMIESRSEFELLTYPEMNIVIYRYIPIFLREKLSKGNLNELDNKLIGQFNERIQKIQRRGGKSFVSRTMIDIDCCGKSISTVGLRVVLANPLTTEDDIKAILDEQVRYGKRLT